jgi:hypothetical protein
LPASGRGGAPEDLEAGGALGEDRGVAAGAGGAGSERVTVGGGVGAAGVTGTLPPASGWVATAGEVTTALPAAP